VPGTAANLTSLPFFVLLIFFFAILSP